MLNISGELIRLANQIRQSGLPIIYLRWEPQRLSKNLLNHRHKPDLRLQATSRHRKPTPQTMCQN